jgi:hypothetical protein
MSKRFIATVVGAMSIALAGAALAAPDSAGKSGKTPPAVSKPKGDVGETASEMASSNKGKGHCGSDGHGHDGGSPGKGHEDDCPASP